MALYWSSYEKSFPESISEKIKGLNENTHSIQCFFSILVFLINIREMNLGKSFFFKSTSFEPRQSVQRGLRRSHASSLGATHFCVDIGCHVNPIDPTITFGIQNESRHFE
jgi:hypothetical protein